ncbi:hypothetical protein CONCODRAFT_8649 [Conidiobolus coronatus NRRL 28638]|uniref:Uncharacterized protein n=1 Tax=Conidiobolus coronatus (strain ATCC 28846 / CBS 209.66 / NRRL 28638) TaxID=796925 RepID=A0A137P1R8_CONC2|nr:hypothetical protein CONCODRAFT_8649 [Conidiobolus coronatus NRRL 28638]|eukprot:KXN69006.1 hypothetical protein CONCODRAFT_8649 [Conidiobolus coronatus NRRL 28638]
MSGFERFNIDSKFDYDISKYDKLIQNYKSNPYLYLNRRYDMYTKVFEFENTDFKLELMILKSPNGVFTLHIKDPSTEIQSLKFNEKLFKAPASKNANTLTKDDELLTLNVNGAEGLSVKIGITFKLIELTQELENDIKPIYSQLYDKNYLFMAQLASNRPIDNWTLTQPRIQDGDNQDLEEE